MDLSYSFAILAALVVIVPSVLKFFQHISSPLRSVPGPFLARWTKGWYLWRVSLGHFEVENRILHEKYGPIVRYAPNRYSVNDLEMSTIVYGHGAQFPKSSWYSAFASPGTWSIFADESIKRHAQNRRMYQNTYSMTSLVSYEPYVDECTDLFVQRLTEFSDAGQPINMGHWFQCYAFDVIGLITYAKRLGFLDCGIDVAGVMHALEEHLFYSTTVGIFAELHRYIFPLYNYLKGKKGAGRAYVLNFTQERMAEFRAQPKAVPADSQNNSNSSASEPFLSKFMAKHADDPDSFTGYHVLTGCATNMVAGSDTTAISLSAILYHLLKHPQCLERLRSEIDALQKPEKSAFTFKESQQLPYLQAVIKEALRVHPATGLPLERVVPEGGATICGRFFPQGTILGVNSWVQHINPLVFGEDADLFKPERWLTEDAKRLSMMNRHWIPFGLGSRTCIGRHISMLEMTKLVPRIIRDFEFELHEDITAPGASWSTQNYWFVKPKGFRVKIALRKPNQAVGPSL